MNDYNVLLETSIIHAMMRVSRKHHRHIHRRVYVFARTDLKKGS
jgi:hypothetical protein